MNRREVLFGAAYLPIRSEGDVQPLSPNLSSPSAMAQKVINAEFGMIEVLKDVGIWNDQRLREIAAGCIIGIIASASNDYNQTVANLVKYAKDFTSGKPVDGLRL
jgi:hypothetical protein